MLDNSLNLKNELSDWLINSMRFSLRIDIPPKLNRNYDCVKFEQDLRQIDYNINLKFLGKSKFRKIKKLKRQNDQLVKSGNAINEYSFLKDRFFVIGFEEGISKLENHYHCLVNVPTLFDNKLSDIIEGYYFEFWNLNYNPFIETVSDNDSSIYYDTKELNYELQGDNPQKFFISYQNT